MNKITQSIFNKLQELENNPKVPFMWVEKLPYSTDKKKYTKTKFIHFDKELYSWAVNFIGGRRYVTQKVELEISQDFLQWIKKFKLTTKEKLIKQLLEEDEDVMRIRCERSMTDFDAVRKSIEKEMQQCFKRLK